MKILIVGGSGLLGSYLIQSLKGLGPVFGLGRSQSNDKEHYFQLDLLKDQEKLDRIFLENKFDVVINCSGHPDPDFCETNPQDAFSFNYVATARLSSALQSNFSGLFIQISTIHCYGTENKTLFEEDIPIPSNYYGQTKLLAEQLIMNYFDHACSLRLPWLYGNMSHSKDPYQKFINELKKKQTFYFNKQDLKYPTSLSDVSRFIKVCITKSLKGTINFSNNDAITKFDFFNKLKDSFNLNAQIEPMNSTPKENPDTKIAKRRSKLLIRSKREEVQEFDFTKLDDEIKNYRKYFESSSL